MKVWKYITLVGGIAGLAGFFLPFVTFESTDNAFTGGVSAFQIVTGIDSINELLSGVGPPALNDQLQLWATDFNKMMAEYRSVIVSFFLPAVLLALVGALAGKRRKMGRFAGLCALVFGAANAGVWAIFHHVSGEQSSGSVDARLGIGIHMLLVAGVAGMVAGLGAMLLPDRGATTEA